MKFNGSTKIGILGLAMISLAFLFTAGCVHRRTVVVREPAPPVGQEVLVVQGPPTSPPPNEVIPVSPGRDYVWTPGHYAWKGDKYVWVSGKYLAKPSPAAVWEPGHWEHRRKGWYWVEGHWR